LVLQRVFEEGKEMVHASRRGSIAARAGRKSVRRPSQGAMAADSLHWN
jgi:hypothetical protein